MDNEVINLSTFGEIINSKDPGDMTFTDVISQMAGQHSEPEVIEIPDPEEMEIPVAKEKAPWSDFIKCSFEYMLCIKMLHWQTHSLGEHKATDKLFSGMLPIMDMITEVAMGKYGRPVAQDWNIPICNYESSEHLQKYLKEMAHCYNTNCRLLFTPEEDSEILNTLDTLIELINKTRYLVTLK
jgi:hypothetical protein